MSPKEPTTVRELIDQRWAEIGWDEDGKPYRPTPEEDVRATRRSPLGVFVVSSSNACFNEAPYGESAALRAMVALHRASGEASGESCG